VAYRRGVWGVQPPYPPDNPKARQIHAKFSPILILLKIAEFMAPTPQDVWKRRQLNPKTTVGSQLLYNNNEK